MDKIPEEKGPEEYNVTLTIQIKARVRVKDGENLDEVITSIKIPENHQCFYVEGSARTLDVEPIGR